MSNRNFDSRVITTRLQNQNYARNLYKYNTSSQTLVHNAQTSDGTSSRNNTYREGAQTEYFRGLLGGGETVSIGGIVNIPPYPTSTVTSPPIPPTPPTIPSAPTINSIIPGNTVLTVNFTAGSNGGSAITNYEYSTDNGINWTSSGSIVSPIVISSLTNGSTYQVKLRAINSVGTGPASIAEPGIPAPTVPQAPEIDNIYPGDSQLTINFYPINDGGSALTDIQYSLDDGGSWISSGVTNSPIIVTGLTNGQQYSVRLQAINSIGTGPASDPAVEATPATTPGAPTNVSINGYNNALVINFIPPVDSGAPITTYWYSINNGTSYLDSDTTVSPIVIKSGVSNGTTYDIRILAVNSEGLGAPSNMVQGTPNPVIQTFTDPAQAYSFSPPYPGILVEYLLVGGGGGSGGRQNTAPVGGGAGGGGGGGQVVTGTFTFIPGAYSVTVGDGGAGGDGTKSGSAANGGDGGPSSFNAGIQANGGTGGLAWGNPPNDGSGGALNSGGSGSTGSAFGAGGGGGNSTAGNNKSGSSGGAGGAGTSSSISGSLITYGAGGNGANAPITPSTASPGADNTGIGASGGSGTGTVNGAKGGSGIVIFKY